MKTFKKTLLFISMLAVFGGAAYGIGFIKNKPIEYVQTAGEVVEIIKSVDPLDEKIAAREKELQEKYAKIQAIEARIDVKEGEVKRLQAEILTDKKELSAFMVAIGSGR